MIGFRGASRYAHPAYAEGFALECAALKRVREQMGLSNVKLMIPFCRRVEEGERVLEAMAANGLRRGVDGLEIYVMCEIPNNIIQIDAFARLFDGFSIGSNDLTQLVLGVDRDSGIVAFDFDERDAGVMAMLRQAVEGARRNHRHVGICGQAPSDYPEMAEYLVGLGIDSISVTPDTLLTITRKVLAAEKGRVAHAADDAPGVPDGIMEGPISLLMTKAAWSADMDDTVAEVANLLTTHRLSWVPVLDQGRVVVGVISTSDLLQFHGRGGDPAKVRAWQATSYKPITVDAATPLAEVAQSMIARKIHHVVVTESDDIAGVVSSLDFVRAFVDRR